MADHQFQRRKRVIVLYLVLQAQPASAHILRRRSKFHDRPLIGNNPHRPDIDDLISQAHIKCLRRKVIITDLGLKVRRNQSEMKQQDNMIQQFKEIRSSISSVNMDEELTNMVQYQKAYEASARFLGTVDEMMETVINMK